MYTNPKDIFMLMLIHLLKKSHRFKSRTKHEKILYSAAFLKANRKTDIMGNLFASIWFYWLIHWRWIAAGWFLLNIW